MVFFARSGLRLGAFILVFLFAPRGTFAATPSLLIHCLQQAQGVEQAAYIAKKKYILDAEAMNRKLTEACVKLEYAVTVKPDGGFRITASLDKETWSIDESDDLVRLSGSQTVAEPVPASGAPSATAAEAPATPAEALESSAPKIATSPPEMDPVRIRMCKSKQLYHTKACQDIFKKAELGCSGGSLPAEACEEFQKVVSSESDLREKVLGEKCKSPLYRQRQECRDFLGASGPPPATVKETPIPRPKLIERAAAQIEETKIEPAAAQGSADQRTLVRYLRDVQPLNSSLQSVMLLKPVGFKWAYTERPDIGFIAEEVSLVDSRLGSYTKGGTLDGVNYQHLSALLTGGIQELYGICKDNTKMEKNLISRLTELERENDRLKTENESMRHQLNKQADDLAKVKRKLGLP